MKHYLETIGWGGLVIAAVYITGCGVVTVIDQLTKWGYL